MVNSGEISRCIHWSRRLDTLSGEITSTKLFLLGFRTEPLFQKGIGKQVSKQEVLKVISLVKYGIKSSSCVCPLKQLSGKQSIKMPWLSLFSRS